VASTFMEDPLRVNVTKFGVVYTRCWQYSNKDGWVLVYGRCSGLVTWGIV
jgi:hypothetical protein